MHPHTCTHTHTHTLLLNFQISSWGRYMLMCVSVCCASCFYPFCLYHLYFASEEWDFDQCVTGPLFLPNQSAPVRHWTWYQHINKKPCFISDLEPGATLFKLPTRSKSSQLCATLAMNSDSCILVIILQLLFLFLLYVLSTPVFHFIKGRKL